jgi:hypothetical protein
MSKAQFIVWQPSSANTATIASLQTLVAAGNLVLNTNTLPNNVGAFPNNTIPYGSYYFNQVVRSLSFTSANDLSGVEITINGLGSPVYPSITTDSSRDINQFGIGKIAQMCNITQLGVTSINTIGYNANLETISVNSVGNPTQPVDTPIQETITAGPNANTIYSEYIYSRIDSISVNGAVQDISVGFGSFGITTYLFPDLNRKAWYANVNSQVLEQTNLTYTCYVSPNTPYVPGTNGTFLPFTYFTTDPIPAFPVLLMQNATTNVTQILITPMSTIWWVVTDNLVENADETAIFTLVQQGIS